VLLMPATATPQAKVIAERVRAAADRDIAVAGVDGDASIRQTVSIGVATWDERETSDSLQARADEAMYTAKQRGRNRVEMAREKRKAKARPRTNGKAMTRAR
jgi:two-component system cell cycle response regulator